MVCQLNPIAFNQDHLHTPQIVSAKYVQRGKPAPDVYLETLRRLGCTDASQALVVEDAGGRPSLGD